MNSPLLIFSDWDDKNNNYDNSKLHQIKKGLTASGRIKFNSSHYNLLGSNSDKSNYPNEI